MKAETRIWESILEWNRRREILGAAAIGILILAMTIFLIAILTPETIHVSDGPRVAQTMVCW